MKHLGTTLFIAATVVLTTTSAPAQEVDGIGTFREALSLESVGGVAISPDGTTVAFQKRRTVWEDNGYDTEIWIAPASGAPYQLTRTIEGNSSSPAWSPDGRWLSFTANRGDRNQVYLISPSGGEAFVLTSVEGGVSSYAWSPSGGQMALRVTEPESEEDKTRQELYGDFAFDSETGRSAHLWVIDVDMVGEASEPRRLTGTSMLAASAGPPTARGWLTLANRIPPVSRASRPTSMCSRSSPRKAHRLWSA